MAKRFPLTAQGRQGVVVKLSPLELEVLAHLGGAKYTRIADVIRDLLRMALAPRVAALAAAKRAREDWARARYDDKLIRETAARSSRRAHAEGQCSAISDEPLAAISVNLPVYQRDAFAQHALRNGTNMSAMLRDMVTKAIAAE